MTRVGALVLPADPWPDAVATARRLEALGYDHLWTYDHLSWRRYRDRPWHAALPWLTGIACATSTIRLGTMVATPNFRHPVPLAKEVMTLDHVSGGRFTLGVGVGGTGFDAEVLGDAPLARAEYVERFADFVALLDRLLVEPSVTEARRHFSAHEARMLPGCVQQPRVPLAIAAGGSRTLALVARHGDGWITYGDTSKRETSREGTEQVVRDQLRRLEDECAKAGRDPATLQRIYLMGNTDERPLASVEAFADVAGRYAELGFTDLVFHHPRPDDEVWNEPVEIVERIAADVLPGLRST